MARAPVPPLLCWSISVILCLFITRAQGLSWGLDRRVAKARSSPDFPASRHDSSHASNFGGSGLPNMYAVALHELQELESEPLCHRIAARLLVNNCQLLDGTNEATVLTDSGRAARDFVDSYAASLAICDLERGSFSIPSACSKFRESTLAGIPPPSKPQIHVTSAEIDSCLEGLAHSDSAWNTWVSYRHKTLRFCEAARADNEKDQNIRVHQRITKILARLTDKLEEEIDVRFQSLNQLFQDASTAVETLKPRVDHLRDGFAEFEMMLNDRITRNTQQSADFVHRGLDDARYLQQLLAVLVETVRSQSDEMAAAHESALQVATQKVGNEMGVVMTTLAAAAASSTSLQRELESSQLRAAEVARRQEKIETGMKRLEGLADVVLMQHARHQERLDKAQQAASELLSVIDSVSSSAATLKSSFYSGFGWTAWWPYVFCPVTSLVVGSYGLPPSTTRNFMLISLGEVAGFIVSLAKQSGGDFIATFTHGGKANLEANSTSTTFGEAIYPNNDLIKDGGIGQVKLTKGVY